MPTLKDLLPRQAQLAVPFVLLPMDLQAGLRGLITQVSTFTDSKTNTRVSDFSCTYHSAQLNRNMLPSCVRCVSLRIKLKI